MLLGMGALLVAAQALADGRSAGGIPFAILAAAGISALGVGFGAWVLMGLALLAIAGRAGIRRGGWTPAGPGCCSAGWDLSSWCSHGPPGRSFSSSFAVSKTIASTSNPGNLQSRSTLGR